MRIKFTRSCGTLCLLFLSAAQAFSAEPAPCSPADSVFSLPAIGLDESSENSGEVLRKPDLSLAMAIGAIGTPALQSEFRKEQVAEWHFAFRRGRTEERCNGKGPSTTYQIQAYILKIRFGTHRQIRCEASRYSFNSPKPHVDLDELSIVEKKSLDCPTLIDTLWPRNGHGNELRINANEVGP